MKQSSIPLGRVHDGWGQTVGSVQETGLVWQGRLGPLVSGADPWQKCWNLVLGPGGMSQTWTEHVMSKARGVLYLDPEETRVRLAWPASVDCEEEA